MKEKFDETEHLMSTEANCKDLDESITELKAGKGNRIDNDEIFFGDLAQDQKDVCRRVGSEFMPVDVDDIVGFALETFNSLKQPINGLRHPPENGTSGWYLWAGEYSAAVDFFKPLHVGHIENINSKIFDYLALAPGWRFLIDDNGYEDVWFDDNLLKLSNF